MSEKPNNSASSRGLDAPIESVKETEAHNGVNTGTPVGTVEATKHGQEGGYAASGFTETLTLGSDAEPTDAANLADATTGASSAPGFGVLNDRRADAS